MKQQDAVNPEGLRVDGRRPNELRKIQCRLGGFPGDGSAVFMQGNTHVVASVYGPRERKGRSQSMEQKAVVTCEYSMAAFSTMDRKVPMRRDRRALEISTALADVFAAAIEVERFPRSEIRLVATVLSADGGTRCAAINALTLALVDAGVPLRGLVAACAAGRVGDAVLADPCQQEDAAGADLPVALLPESGRLLLCQMDSKLSTDDFPALLTAASDAAMRVAEILRAALHDRLAVVARNRALEARPGAAEPGQDE